MSLNDNRGVGTLQGKLTRLYVTLFMVTQIICVTVLYLCQRHSVYSHVRKRMEIFREEFTYEYMTGGEFTHLKNRCAPERVSKAMMAAVKTHEPRFVAETAYVDPEGNTTVLGSADGVVHAFTSPAGIPAAIARHTYHVPDRIGAMNLEFNEESYGEDVNHILFLLLAPDGKVLAKSGFTEVDASLFTDRLPPTGRKSYITRLAFDRDGILACYRRQFDGNILVVGEQIHQFSRYIVNLFYAILLTLALSLGVSIYCGRMIARRFVGGVTRITKAARRIESGNYSARVAHGSEGAEINDLADAFNDMTHNTERLLSELRSFSDNLAHDLRTPLTRMRGQAELSLCASRENELACDVAEECGNLLTMINTMLEITQTEFNSNASGREELDLAAIARDTIDLFSTVGDDKGVAIKTDIPDAPLMLTGYKVKLQRLLANLLDNAIKFTPAGGTVSVGMRRDADNVVLSVADTGCGIPETDRERIFDRFYRSDSSRNIPGNGLGLSLVKAIVESCNGSIAVVSQEGRGTVFTLRLPTVCGRN